MKKRRFPSGVIGVFVLLILVAILVAIILTSGKGDEEESTVHTDDTLEWVLDRAEKIAGTDLEHGEVVRFSDTHGGFLGDGDVFLELQYSDEDYKQIEEQISTQKKYLEELPMAEELARYLMGWDFEVPQSGYYLFYDRHSDADDRHDYKEMGERASRNFSVIILDQDAKKIIYFEMDT